jgi:hypothetical protein
MALLAEKEQDKTETDEMGKKEMTQMLRRAFFPISRNL